MPTQYSHQQQLILNRLLNTTHPNNSNSCAPVRALFIEYTQSLLGN